MLLYFLFLVHLLPVAASDVDNVKGRTAEVEPHTSTRLAHAEMGFKLWLIPGVQECYHEVLEKSSRIYFMYEILNAQSDDDRIVVFFRDAHNRNILSLSRTPRRGHLDLLINDTSERQRSHSIHPPRFDCSAARHLHGSRRYASLGEVSRRVLPHLPRRQDARQAARHRAVRSSLLQRTRELCS